MAIKYNANRAGAAELRAFAADIQLDGRRTPCGARVPEVLQAAPMPCGRAERELPGADRIEAKYTAIPMTEIEATRGQDAVRLRKIMEELAAAEYDYRVFEGNCGAAVRNACRVNGIGVKKAIEVFGEEYRSLTCECFMPGVTGKQVCGISEVMRRAEKHEKAVFKLCAEGSTTTGDCRLQQIYRENAAAATQREKADGEIARGIECGGCGCGCANFCAA